MIQRTQSLYLLLASLLALATWFFPISTHQRGDAVYELRTTGLFTSDGQEVQEEPGQRITHVPFEVVMTVIAVALAGCILLYRNRPRQMRFVRGTYMVVLGTIAYLFITDRSVQAYLGQDGPVRSSYGLSFVLPLIILVLAFMAERAIKADEDLVRSADRLR
jgi:hypothetical protein